MALIKCPECGKEISDKAKICIGCGFPIEEMISESVSLEEASTEVVETTVQTCIYCNSISIDSQGYCNECGMKQDNNTRNQKDEKEADNDPIYTICPSCNKRNKKDDYKCIHCGHVYKVGEYVLHIDEDKLGNSFNGVYRYNKGKLQEVYCPRCMSSNCTHYKERKIIPAKSKTRYTANLNPLRPFTLVNKKEKMVGKEISYTENKFLCNTCGYIFD